jgi:hypothetical protein
VWDVECQAGAFVYSSPGRGTVEDFEGKVAFGEIVCSEGLTFFFFLFLLVFSCEG